MMHVSDLWDNYCIDDPFVADHCSNVGTFVPIPLIDFVLIINCPHFWTWWNTLLNLMKQEKVGGWKKLDVRIGDI